MPARGSPSKSTPPRIWRAIRRERLYRRLDEASVRSLVWVSAPAGAGKTTLVASWLAERDRPFLWYQLDASDADIGSFLLHLGRAAKRLVPGRKSLPLLTPEQLVAAPSFVRRFFDALYARLPRGTVVVLDDYQELSEDTPLHGILAQAILAAPEGVSFVVASRVAPPPQFARVSAQGLATRVDWDDLRLSPQEAKQLLRALGARGSSAQELREAYERTEGWAAGLVLLAAGATRARTRGVDEPEVTPGLFDYFASEVFSKASREEQEVLLRTSLLPRMTTRSVVRLTGIAESPRILERLCAQRFFTERYGDDFQYHPLFRAFLLDRLKSRSDASALRTFRVEAARILVEAGEPDAAYPLLFDARATDELAGVLLAQAPALVAEGRQATLGHWLGVLPGDLGDSLPWLRYWAGVCLMSSDLGASLEKLEDAFRSFERDRDRVGTLLAWCGAVDALIYQWTALQRLDPWIAWLDARVQEDAEFIPTALESQVSGSMLWALVWRQPMGVALAIGGCAHGGSTRSQGCDPLRG